MCPFPIVNLSELTGSIRESNRGLTLVKIYNELVVFPRKRASYGRKHLDTTALPSGSPSVDPRPAEAVAPGNL